MEKLISALEALLNEYVTDVDPFRVGGFYQDPETEDVVIEARKAIAEARNSVNGDEGDELVALREENARLKRQISKIAIMASRS